MQRRSNILYLPRRRRDRWALIMVVGTVVLTAATAWLSQRRAAVEQAKEDLDVEIRGYYNLAD